MCCGWGACSRHHQKQTVGPRVLFSVTSGRLEQLEMLSIRVLSRATPTVHVSERPDVQKLNSIFSVHYRSKLHHTSVTVLQRTQLSIQLVLESSYSMNASNVARLGGELPRSRVMKTAQQHSWHTHTAWGLHTGAAMFQLRSQISTAALQLQGSQFWRSWSKLSSSSWNQKVHYRIYKSSPLNAVLGHVIQSTMSHAILKYILNIFAYKINKVLRYRVTP